MTISKEIFIIKLFNSSRQLVQVMIFLKEKQKYFFSELSNQHLTSFFISSCEITLKLHLGLGAVLTCFTQQIISWGYF